MKNVTLQWSIDSTLSNNGLRECVLDPYIRTVANNPYICAVGFHVHTETISEIQSDVREEREKIHDDTR